LAPAHLPQPKKKARAQHAALIHADEASFRQDSTLHRTWARRGCQPQVPVTGERKSVKIFGCVELYSARFTYHRDTVFNAETYLDFLEQVARCYYPHRVIFIQDNASYHKDQNVSSWFEANHSWWETYNLPPYSPELNATERLWHHTRISGTHNRYFASHDELVTTLTSVFRSMQRRPDQIRGYLAPFI
jgi:transposase